MRDSSARQATTEFGQPGFPHSLLDLCTTITCYAAAPATRSPDRDFPARSGVVWARLAPSSHSAPHDRIKPLPRTCLSLARAPRGPRAQGRDGFFSSPIGAERARVLSFSASRLSIVRVFGTGSGLK